MAKIQKSPEEKEAASELRKANLIAANKKRAELKAANKPPVADTDKSTTPFSLKEEMKKAEDSILKDLEQSNLGEVPAKEEAEEIPVASKDFESILADIKDGKEVTIEDEKGVYFRFEEGRLKKFSKQGGFMDSYPLYALQNRKGWALKK